MAGTEAIILFFFGNLMLLVIRKKTFNFAEKRILRFLLLNPKKFYFLTLLSSIKKKPKLVHIPIKKTEVDSNQKKSNFEFVRMG